MIRPQAAQRAARRPQCAVKWDRNLKPKLAIMRQCTSVTDRRTLTSLHKREMYYVHLTLKTVMGEMYTTLSGGLAWSCCTSRAAVERSCTGTATWRLTAYIAPCCARRQSRNTTTSNWPRTINSPAGSVRKSETNIQVRLRLNVLTARR